MVTQVPPELSQVTRAMKSLVELFSQQSHLGSVYHKDGEQDPNNDLLYEGDCHQVPQVGCCH